MQITLSQSQGLVPVTIVQPHGAIDASSFQELIQAARNISAEGGRYILVDLSQVSFMSSAGLVALHTIALMLRGEKPPDLESGWDTYKSVARDMDTGKQKFLKLLNPNQNVNKMLTMSGFKNFLEVHSDLEEAVASFNQ